MCRVRLDAIDEKIITLLVEDARRSFADVGGRVGLTA
jgi:DNA-binding Lrp family transcriptional regulator